MMGGVEPKQAKPKANTELSGQEECREEGGGPEFAGSEINKAGSERARPKIKGVLPRRASCLVGGELPMEQ